MRAASWHRRVNAPLWTALLATLLCSLLYVGHRARWLTIPGLDEWERSTVDLRFRMRGERAPADDQILVVGLDDATRQEAPEVWQSRRGLARVIEKLSEGKPRAVGIDAFFSSPEINLSGSSVRAVRQAIASLRSAEELDALGQQALDTLLEVDEETRGDQVLAQALSKSPQIALATLFFYSDRVPEPGSPEPSALSKARVADSAFVAQAPGHRALSASSALLPLDAIGEAAAYLAHVNVRKDDDGAVHEVPLVIEYAGRHYQAMALHLASRGLGAPSSYASGDRFVGLGSKHLPVSQRARARLNFLGPAKTFPHLSVLDLLRHSGPHPALEGKLVLMGYTDSARDKLITPFDESLDGVELHATLLHNILHDELLREAGPWTGAWTITLLGALLSLLQLRRIRRRGPWLLIVGSLALMALHIGVSHYLFSRSGLVVDMVAPALALIVIVLAAVSAALVTEGREKAQIRSAFGQYLQRSMVEKILQDPERLRLGGQRRELTVLFSDIRSFSRFSEALPPEELSDFLNEYLTPMTDLVLEDDGTLDKYIGDAVMAFYGAPIRLEDHAERACKTALAMLARLEPLNREWKKRELPEVRIGIGINTGDMSVGNMGSKSRFDYTVMGDAVNLAARLESLTKAYGVSVLAGESTMKLASGSYVFRELDFVRVIGRQAAARIYELVAPRGEGCPLSDSDLQLFGEALEHYRAAHWAPALEALEQFLARHPGDGPAQVLLERTQTLQASPPAEDWDGVYEQRSK